MVIKNLFSTGNLDKSSEVFQDIISGKSFRLERIVSSGHVTPQGEWYDQDADEWVILLSGSATLLFKENEETIELKPGDYLHIPAHKKHRVEKTDKEKESVWLAVHFET